MGSKYWDRQPIGETITGKVARDTALKKMGIDPRTPAEIAKDAEDRRAAVRTFNKYDREHNEVVETNPTPSDPNE